MDYFPEEILRRDESCKVVKRRSQILRVRSEIFRELWVSSLFLERRWVCPTGFRWPCKRFSFGRTAASKFVKTII